jgi:glycerol 2-dehydrogenase (NADP+)
VIVEEMFLNDPEIKAIADRLGATTGQVVLSWGVHRGTVVIPKTEKPERMTANITIVELTKEDMSVVDNYYNKPG